MRAIDKQWDFRFLTLAMHIGSWSKDPSTKVGAVIVDQQRRIVSTGYNGFPRGVLDTQKRLKNRKQKYGCTIHAEMNAILFAQRNLTGCTIYTTPFQPCSNCAAAIIQVGIVRVVTFPTSEELAERWKDSIELAKQMLGEAGVQLYIFKD